MSARAMLVALPVFFASPALAQHAGHAQQPAPAAQQAPPQPTRDQAQQEPSDAQTESAPAMEMSWPTASPVGNEPPPPAPSDHAADRVFDPEVMRAAREAVRREHGGTIVSQVMLNLLEYQVDGDDGGYRWDGEARIGGDINRFALKSEGEGAGDGLDSAEVQVLYSRAIGPYFDAQAGLRYDFEPSPNRTYAVLGVEGVAPYWFELGGALFLSDHGELSGRIDASYDLRLTQRLVLQPRAELDLLAEDVPELGVGAGLSEAELGVRLRYEVRREFAPYVGLTLDRKFGETAAFARVAGEDTSEGRVVVGLRAWF